MKPNGRRLLLAGNSWLVLLSAALSVGGCEPAGETPVAPAEDGGSVPDAGAADGAPTFPSSRDGDGFLWGTEGNVNTADASSLPATAAAARDAINGVLKSKYVKLRISMAFFTTSDSGRTYSTAYCLPSPSQCHASFDMDEVAKVYQANGWSMVPMFRHDESQVITTALIDGYVDFVDWFVGRYRELASIEMIELVNSPHAENWQGTDAQLLELTNKTYDRVKSRYPGIAVGTPGFEYWLDSETDPSGKPMIQNVAYFLDPKNGAKFDFWAFHGYALRPVTSGGVLAPYPPTKSPTVNPYGGMPGILRIRADMDANGWQDRPIIDTEHDVIAPFPGQSLTPADDLVDAAFLIQDLLLKRTIGGERRALSGALPLKMAIRGAMGEAAISSLNADGSAPLHVKAMGLFWEKLQSTRYVSHVSGAFDDEDQAWVERFAAGNRELYVFFKPFGVQSGPKLVLDGQVLDYPLALDRIPVSATLTDVTGKVTPVAPAQTLTLAAENSPKFLELTY